MIKPKTFERALHGWQPWLEAVVDGRRKHYRDADGWWAYGAEVLRSLHFPGKPLLRLYFLNCVFSRYDRDGTFYFDDIQLPPIMFEKYDLFNTRIAPAIARFVILFDFLRISPIRLCPDLMAIRDRLLPPAVWNEHDIGVALQWERSHLSPTWVSCEGVVNEEVNLFYEDFRKYYSPFFMVLAPGHPLIKTASKLKRKADDAQAVRSAEMKDLEGYTYRQIAEQFGWAIQEDEWGKPSRSSTASRYVRRGRWLRGI